MDPADRIAAYLADELDDVQRRAFEDDLERDATLRDQLDAVHRADAALAGPPPTALPDGAEQRLHEVLRDELATTLAATAASDGGAADADPAPTTGPDTGPGVATFTASSARDELAAHRERRRIPWSAIGGVAAAVVGFAVVAVGPLGLLDGDGDRVATGLDEVAEAPFEESAEMDSAADGDPFAGPVLRGSERPMTEEESDALLDDPAARTLADAGLDEEAAAGLAASHAAAFGVERSEVELDEPRAALRTEGAVEPEVRDRIADCLEVVLEGGGTPVVVAAETVTFGGEPAVAFTLVGRDGSSPLGRPEAWVVALGDCSVRYFTQG